MRRTTRRTLACLALAALTSCAKHSWYGYQYKSKTRFGGGEEPEPAPVEARQLLASAKTVAFFPPDECVNINPDVDHKRVQELRASCGVLLSTLERAAERAGYEVLSWQNLRGAKRPIEYAREANVDVLFEINQFELRTLKDKQIERTIAFFERDEDGRDRPLQVSSALAQTCATYSAADHDQEAGDLGTIDIKTVSVADGRARWRYRKTLSESRGRTYPVHSFAAAHQPHPVTGILVTGASIAGVVGIMLFAFEHTFEDDPATPDEDEGFDSGGWSTNMLVLTGLFGGGTVAAHYGLGTKKPSPDGVLCNSEFESRVETPSVAAPSGTVAAEHTFEETQVEDANVTKQQQISDRMIAEFIDVLKDVHGDRPEGPAPAIAPAPPPAAP